MSGTLILLKLAMGRYPAVDVVVPLSRLIEACTYYYKKNDAHSFVVGSGVRPEAVDESNAIFISDLEDTPKHFSLLMVRGDPNRAIPAFVNPKTRIIRTGTPDEPGFVPGASCHLVISKQEIARGADQGRFRVAKERTRGISRSLVRDFLTQLMARYAEEHQDKFTANKKRRSKKEKPSVITYHPTVRFHPQENGSLKRDLQEGRIAGFKLTRGRTSFQGAANEAAVQRLDVQLTARIAPTNNFSRVKRLVDHVQQTLDTISFERLNLELIDEGGHPMPNPRSIAIEDLDEGDMRYCKTVDIPGLEGEIEAYSSFCEPIKSFAIKILNNEEYWS